MIVLDASFLLGGFLPGSLREECAALLERVWRGEIAAYAPGLLKLECANTVLRAVHAEVISQEKQREYVELLEALPLTYEEPPRLGDVVEVAARHRLTAYDAAYLELALRHRFPLHTLDGALQKAARAEGLAEAA